MDKPQNEQGFPKSLVSRQFEVPQEYELFGSLFAPLGFFAFSFVKLERALSWSFVVSNTIDSELDTSILLKRAAEFEGGNKRASQRISKWFNSLRSSCSQTSRLEELNKLKCDIEVLNKHRNRLLHDSSGAVSQNYRGKRALEPEFHFNQQMKSGETQTHRYSARTIFHLAEETVSLKAEIRRITIAIIPHAPNIEI